MRLAPIVQSLTEPLLSPLVSAITGASGSGFSPTSLFVSGEQGYVYDLNDSFAEKTAYRRNLLTYSEQFDNAAWTKSGLTVTPNDSTAPDGAVTADFVYVSATGTFREVFASASMTSGVTYTQTYYVKAAGINYCQILFPGAFGGNDIANFDLTDGTVGTVVSVTTGLSAQVQSVGSGWYRISATFAGVATGSYRASLCLIPSKTAARGDSMTANASLGIYVWGAQLEAGSVATDYQRVTDWNTELLAAFPQTAVYLDSAGTTPASVNGLVGLVLDKSKAAPVARRNLLVSTNNPAGTGWTRASVTASDAGIALPTGDNLYSIIPNAAAVTAYLQQPVTAGIAQTISWYGRSDEYTGVRMRDGGGTVLCHFDFATGAVTDAGGATGSMTAVGGGTYYCTITYTPASTTFRLHVASLVSDGVSTSPAGDGTSGIYLGSFQLEAGSTATEYQRVVTGNGDWIAGNHAYQSTTGNKPVLRGSPVGANLVTNGDFASGTSGWTAAGGATVSWASGKMRVTNSAGGGRGTGEQTLTTVIGKTYRVRFSATAGTASSAFFGAAQATNAGSIISGAANSLGTDIYFTAVGTTTYIYAQPNTTTASQYIDVDNIEVVDVSAGQVQAPYALQFDGVDDFLQTASVNFTATDKMTVCHGVRKLSDAALGMLAELSTAAPSFAGAFYLTAPFSTSGPYGFFARGGADPGTAATTTNLVAPNLSVVTCQADIVGDSRTMRINGSANGSSASDLSTGNFGNYPIYFGRRAGASFPYNGLMYSAICVGKSVSATELANIERWTNQRTGAY